MNYPWVALVNTFTGDYYNYLEANRPSNLRTISDEYILPLLQEAMNFRNTIGYDESTSRDIVVLGADIRKDIAEIESNCIYYAENLEKQFDEYFAEGNTHVLKLRQIKQKIDAKITEHL